MTRPDTSRSVDLLKLHRSLINLARNFLETPLENLDEGILKAIEQLREATHSPCLFFSLISPDGKSLDKTYLSDQNGRSGPHNQPSKLSQLGISLPPPITGDSSLRQSDISVPVRSWPCCADVCPPNEACRIQLVQSNDRAFAVIGHGCTEDSWCDQEDLLETLMAGADILCKGIHMFQTKIALRDSQERLELAQFAGRSVAWDWDPVTDRMYMSPSAAEIFGYDPSVIPETGDQLRQRIPPEDRDRVKAAITESLKTGNPYEVEHRFLMPDNRTILWINAKGRSVKASDGRVRRLLGLSADITQRKKAEAALIKEQLRAQVTLNSLDEGVIRTDAAGLIDYMNPAAEELCGHSLQELEATYWTQGVRLFPEGRQVEQEDLIATCLAETELIRPLKWYRLFQPSGREFAIQVSASPLRGKDSEIQGAVLVLQNLSELRKLERERAYLASHDSLTGALNRSEFQQKVTTALTEVSNDGGPLALCFLDLNTFKVINDSCGLLHGDNMLRQVSALLESEIQGNDIFARIGGEKFGLLLKGCDLEEAARRAKKLIGTLRGFRFLAENRVFTISMSLGIVPVDKDSPPFDDLMMAADAACYFAKEKGRNTYHVATPDDSEISRRSRQGTWAKKISHSLQDDSFVLFLQKILPLGSSARPELAEFLIRMRDRDKIIEPGSFLGAAERYNLMTDIDRWVVRNALRNITEQKRSPTEVRYSVNLSGQSLSQEGTLSFLLEEIETSMLDPVQLCFEITETAAITNLMAAKRLIHSLNDRGCTIALDDFGSGLSSFRYLQELPVQYLKIDGNLIRDIATDPVQRSMVEAIQKIADTMNLTTIGEWVESEETLEILRDLGLDYAQGFVIERPHAIGIDAP